MNNRSATVRLRNAVAMMLLLTAVAAWTSCGPADANAPASAHGDGTNSTDNSPPVALNGNVDVCEPHGFELISDEAAAHQASLRAMLDKLERRLTTVLANTTYGVPVRKNGYVYAVDVALLMQLHALRGNRDAFTRLLPVVDRLTAVGRKHETHYEARDMVCWRYNPDDPDDLDASGTTETAEIARGLWLGSRAFDDDALADQAERLIDAYVRHGYETDDGFFIRNYFNFGTRAYATNTYMIDYVPGFLYDFAVDRGRDDLVAIARSCARFVAGSQYDTGLYAVLYQDEINTVIPGYGAYFSPDGITRLDYTAIMALELMDLQPDCARRAWDFAKRAGPPWYVCYYAKTGKPAMDVPHHVPTGPVEIGLIARLALHFEGREAALRVVGEEWLKWLRGLNGGHFDTWEYVTAFACVIGETLLRDVSAE